jgi:hypothetical protein
MEKMLSAIPASDLVVQWDYWTELLDVIGRGSAISLTTWRQLLSTRKTLGTRAAFCRQAVRFPFREAVFEPMHVVAACP